MNTVTPGGEEFTAKGMEFTTRCRAVTVEGVADTSGGRKSLQEVMKLLNEVKMSLQE